MSRCVREQWRDIINLQHHNRNRNDMLEKHIKTMGVIWMVSAELLTMLQGLSRADKLYIIQVLISEFAQQETDLIKPSQSYPVWSPYDAFEAADTMLKVLQAAKIQCASPYQGSKDENLLANGELVTIEDQERSQPETEPWLKHMGIFADDPTFDDFSAEVAAYRQLVDAQES